MQPFSSSRGFSVVYGAYDQECPRASTLWCTACLLWCTACLVVPWSLNSILMHLIAAEPLSIAGLLYLIQYLYGTILNTLFDGVRLEGFKRRVNASLLPSVLSPFLSPLFSFSFHLFYGLALWVRGLRTDRVHPLSPSLPCRLF